MKLRLLLFSLNQAPTKVRMYNYSILTWNYFKSVKQINLKPEKLPGINFDAFEMWDLA